MEHGTNLCPQFPHHAQHPIYGKLFYNQVIMYREGNPFGFICNSCADDLASKKVPQYTLANNLWIGDVPEEMAILMLPEPILVSIYYPAAYIVKLYSK